MGIKPPIERTSKTGSPVQLVLATNNKNKIIEIKRLLHDLPITILTRDDFKDFPDPDETGATLEENAILKAKEIAAFCKMPALADDTGLEVDALGGAPGIYSARYAGENVSYTDNNRKMLSELKGVPREKRTARFRCVIAIAWDANLVETVVGQAEGIICDDLAGHDGFGYDPIFFYPPADKRFSEMTVDEKNAISHRGLALKAAVALIEKQLNKA